MKFTALSTTGKFVWAQREDNHAGVQMQRVARHQATARLQLMSYAKCSECPHALLASTRSASAPPAVTPAHRFCVISTPSIRAFANLGFAKVAATTMRACFMPPCVRALCRCLECVSEQAARFAELQMSTRFPAQSPGLLHGSEGHLGAPCPGPSEPMGVFGR